MNKVTYYHGTTRLLVITLRPHVDTLPSFAVTANKHYAKNTSCADLFKQLKSLGLNSPSAANEVLKS